MIRTRMRGDDFRGLADGMIREDRPKMEAAVLDSALILHGTVKRKLSRSGTGRTYVRGGVVHVASAPGQAPAPDKGRLRNSIAFGPTESAVDAASDQATESREAPNAARVSWRGLTARMVVGTNVVYAAILEHGGQAGAVRIVARPYMQPSEDEARPKIDRRMERL